MKKRFHSKEASTHFFACLIAIVVIVGIHLVNWLVNDNTPPRNPVMVKLEKPATLRGRVNDEDFEIKVKKGHEIKILGVREGTMSEPERLWVELEDGSRGYIYCTDFDLEYKAQLNDKKGLDPVKFRNLDKTKMVCELEDGSVENLYCDDVFPQWPDSLKLKYLSTETYSSYISKDKFEKTFLGSSLEQNDGRLVPARYVYRKGGKTYAFYPMYVLDTSDGMRHAPTVVYDESGEAKSYINEYSKKRAKLFLRFLPFVGPVVDNPFCNSLIQGSMYKFKFQEKGEPSFLLKIPIFLLALVYLAFVLIWMYATPMVPVLLLAVLMHYPKLLYPFSNKVLDVTMIILSIVFSYLWGVLLVGWGIMWLFLLPLPFAALFIFAYASSPLAPSAPCRRCLGCRHIDSMEFADTVYDHDYREWSREKKYAQTLNVRTRTWQTWTQVTRRNSDGSTSSWRENVKDHKETITTNLYNDYDVLYNVTVYRNNYECGICGQREYNLTQEYEELERRYLGNHSETHVN
jgi:hypothetical protein